MNLQLNLVEFLFVAVGVAILKLFHVYCKIELISKYIHIFSSKLSLMREGKYKLGMWEGSRKNLRAGIGIRNLSRTHGILKSNKYPFSVH